METPDFGEFVPYYVGETPKRIYDETVGFSKNFAEIMEPLPKDLTRSQRIVLMARKFDLSEQMKPVDEPRTYVCAEPLSGDEMLRRMKARHRARQEKNTPTKLKKWQQKVLRKARTCG